MSDKKVPRYQPNFLTVNPSTIESLTSGGTAGILPTERKKATFVTEKLTNILDGDEKKTARRRFILSPTEGQDLSDKSHWTRPEMLKHHVKHFIDVHKDYWTSFIPTREEAGWMMENSMFSGAFMNHYGLFLPTLAAQCDTEQKMKYLPPTLQMQIIGCYAQTELGHGSNVRGLMTIAEYDKEAQEFVLNTPTLRSIKWWPGALGKVGTHAIVYAQLIIDKKEYGVHAFIVQIRDENHKPLPGIELGDLGTKLGDHANDTGYMVLNNLRISREAMLAAHQQVTPDGKYVKSEKRKKNDKLHYATMMFTRGFMVKSAGGFLARAVTIAIRYSCVRTQGFITKKVDTYKAPERQIIDHQVQRYRLFKQLALSYAIKFTGKWMLHSFAALDGDTGKSSIEFTNLDELPFLAATSAGLKALCTVIAWQGIEDCRKCCGGNGYLLNSGIASIAADYVWQSTAEGDWVILMLQTAGFLIKTVNETRAGKSVSGPVDYLAPLQDKGFTLSRTAPPAKSVDDFLNLDYLLQLFRYGALASVLNADISLKRKLSPNRDNYDESWNATSIELLLAVRAHCFYFLMINFVGAAKTITDQTIQSVMIQICALFACSTIMDENYWNSLIVPEQMDIVKASIFNLLEAIRPNAVALVDAFDIPDRVLNSTIGRFDGNVYEALYNSVKKNPLNLNDPFDGYEENLRPYLDLEFLKLGNKAKL